MSKSRTRGMASGRIDLSNTTPDMDAKIAIWRNADHIGGTKSWTTSNFVNTTVVHDGVADSQWAGINQIFSYANGEAHHVGLYLVSERHGTAPTWPLVIEHRDQTYKQTVGGRETPSVATEIAFSSNGNDLSGFSKVLHLPIAKRDDTVDGQNEVSYGAIIEAPYEPTGVGETSTVRYGYTVQAAFTRAGFFANQQIPLGVIGGEETVYFMGVQSVVGNTESLFLKSIRHTSGTGHATELVRLERSVDGVALNIMDMGTGFFRFSLGNDTVLRLTDKGAHLREPVTIISDRARYDVTLDDRLVIVRNFDPATSTTIHLPVARAGHTIFVKDGAATAGGQPITILPFQVNIDGAISWSLAADRGVVRLTYDGTEWVVV